MKTETKTQHFLTQIVIVLLGCTLFVQAATARALMSATDAPDDPPRFAQASGTRAPVVLRPHLAVPARPVGVNAASSCAECKGGVTELTLRYDGAGPVTVTVYNDKKADPSKVLFHGPVSPSGVFSFSKPADKDKLKGDVSVWVDEGSGPVKDTQIHTSCSQPIGPGTVRGSFTVVEAFSKKNGLVCPAPTCLKCKGGVTRLKLQYEGNAPAQVRVEDDGVVIFNQLVDPSGANPIVELIGSASDGKFKKNDLFVFVNNEQNAKIHVSCSKPIGPGSVFGDFVAVEVVSKDNGAVCPLPDCLECKGGVTSLTLQYNGTGPVDIEIKDDKISYPFPGVLQGDEITLNGTESDGRFDKNDLVIFIDGIEQTRRIHVSCSQPIGPGSIFGDLQVTKAVSKDKGNVCPVPDCLECKGGVTRLKLQYNGAAAANIEIKAGSVSYPIGSVAPGGIFTIDGTRSDGKFENNDLDVFVNGVKQPRRIHVSCSQPIGPGAVFGDLQVVQTISKDNGFVCPLPECVACGFGANDADKVSQLTLEYTGLAAGRVRVYDNADQSKLLYDSNTDPAYLGPVPVNGLFSFSASAIGKTEFSSKIGIWVGNVKVAEIHTSCSDALIPNTTTEANQSKGVDPNGHADFLVRAGRDRTGIPLCDADGKRPPEPKPDPCLTDAGPPLITFSIDDGNIKRVIVTVTDDSGILDIMVNASPNLTLHSSTFLPGADPPQTIATITYRINNLDLDATLEVTATDICQQASCDDNQPPSVVAVTHLDAGTFGPGLSGVDYVINDGDNNSNNDVVGPDGIVDRFGRDFFVTDDVGVRTFQTFARVNTINCQFFETTSIGDGTLGPFPAPDVIGDAFGPFECPPPLPVTPFSFSPPKTSFHLVVATEKPFDGNGNPQSGRIGALAADACNAFIFDPALRGGAGKQGAGGVPGGLPGAGAAEVPLEFSLGQNYPNPFNPSTQIDFALPEATDVRLVVFDVLGRVVQVLADGRYAAGQHTVAFDARSLPSGTYFYRIETARQTAVRQMMLLK